MLLRAEPRGASGPPPPRQETGAEERALAAVLRWRTRRLLRTVPPAQARAIRFLPATLQTSFLYPGLREDPPGVEGVTVGRRWASLAASLGLPPPVATRRGRRTVAALLVTVHEDGVLGWALPAENATAEQRWQLQQRVERIRAVLAGRLELVILDAAAAGMVPVLAAFGGLVSGWLPPGFWPEADEVGPLGPETVAELAVAAPTPLAALAVALVAGAAPPHPLGTLRESLAAGIPAAELADPELFAALWAGGTAGWRDELLRLVEWTSPHRSSRRLAAALLERAGPPRRREPSTAGGILALGREVTLAAARAASRAPAPGRTSLRSRLRRESIEPGAPEFLLPLVGRALAAAGIRGIDDLPPAAPADGAYEVEDGSGGVLARGASPAQARIRAEALLVRALGSGRPEDPATRRRLAALARPSGRRTLRLAVTAVEIPGPPFDPLNRGPGRSLALGPALAVVLRPGHRPAARYLSPRELVDRVLAEGRAGTAVAFEAADPGATPASSRLERLARVVSAASRRGGAPPAVEAGGRVYLLGERIRQFPVDRFALRPLPCDPDPEAPDLGVGGPARSGAAPGRIECRLIRAGAGRAALLYLDEHGWVFREEVALADLESHLQETQAILRTPPPGITLALRVGPGFEGADRLRRPEHRLVVRVKVWGDLPFGLGVELHGERFGGGAPLGWGAAALSALSCWPPGADGRLCVGNVSVSVRGRPASGLFRLYARSLALRRLHRHVRWQLGVNPGRERVESPGDAGGR